MCAHTHYLVKKVLKNYALVVIDGQQCINATNNCVVFLLRFNCVTFVATGLKVTSKCLELLLDTLDYSICDVIADTE